MLKRFKRDGKKGFTLVELIVVLVILAILAALLVPALTGYIDKAKKKQIIAETRQAVMAAQTLVDEKYGALDTNADVEETDIDEGDIKELAEVPDSATIAITITNNKIATLEYTNNGKKCTYTQDGNPPYEVIDIP